MIIDCHVHISAFTPPHGSMSAQLQASLPFRFIRWRLGVKGADENAERQVAQSLLRTLEQTTELDAAVVLAFDAVYDREGRFDPANTHLFVTNDYVIELARRHPKVLFGASVHPYRKDAAAEVERCIKAGAVLLKWLPIVQKFDPSDERCFPIYEVLAHYKLPLLSHTGGEKALPVLLKSAADPLLLIPALKRGVTVIAAHCGTRSSPDEPDFLSQWMRMASDYENCYGDTAALNLPTRWYAFEKILHRRLVRDKLVHGSDWPIPAFASPMHLSCGLALRLMRDRNWMRRDVAIKKHLGLGEDYWRRAGSLLRLGSAGAGRPADPGLPATGPAGNSASGRG